MNEIRQKKPVILMQPGPLHLFWTTGVFYFWELKERFDFVFVVPEDYRDSVRFQKLACLPAVRGVEYIPIQSVLARHWYCARRFGQLLRQYLPRHVLMHNRCYAENLYLLHHCWRVCPEARRYFYQNGQSLMSKDDFAARRAIEIEALIHRYPWLATNFAAAGILANLRGKLAFFVNYKLFPFLLSGIVFRPPIDVTNGQIDSEALRQLSGPNNDYLLAYLDNEIEAYRSHGFSNVLKIQHPMRKSGRDVFRFLYRDPVETDCILIVPSYGFTSRLIKDGSSADTVVNCVASRWCEAIQALLDRFPGYELKMKLHPASRRDPLWTRITGKITGQFPAITLVPPEESVEWHVAQSRVIVGDVTTVLWWAGIYGGKIVISLDVFGYPGGDEMRLYPDVVKYMTDVSGIHSLSMEIEGRTPEEADVTSVMSGVRP